MSQIILGHFLFHSNFLSQFSKFLKILIRKLLKDCVTLAVWRNWQRGSSYQLAGAGSIPVVASVDITSKVDPR